VGRIAIPELAPGQVAGYSGTAWSVNDFWGAVDFSHFREHSSWLRNCISIHPEVSSVYSSDTCALDGSRAPDSVSLSSRAWPHLAIAARVQLHNRSDLLRTLGAEVRECAALDDRDLLLAAYAKWGEECPNFLLGEFAFAIWDERLERLFCCRDHIGFRAFLYWRSEKRFIFAGDIEPILACPGVPREVNRRKLAALAVPTAHHTRHEETFHAGILSLPPGVSMTVERNGIRQRRYWEPGLGAGPTVPKRPREAFEALRDILFQAVECRLDRDYPVAATLSGGLDSSSVVAIAARCLEKQNRELRAVAVVVPDESRPQFADERDYIGEFRAWPNINLEYVTARGRGPFDSLGDLSRFAAFPLRGSNFFLEDECAKAAINGGARRILWGFGGEFNVTSLGERYHLELAIRLRWPTLFRELKKRRTVLHYSPIRTLGSQLLNTLFPFRGRQPFVLLARDFQRECDVGPAFVNRSPYQRRYQVEMIRHWIGGKHAVLRGQSVALVPESYPLLDKRLLEFCLAMPAGMDVREGYPRYPVRAALDGILPPRIQWRTSKMPFSPDYYARYNAQIGIAREFVAAIGPQDPVRTIVDVERLQTLLAPVDAVAGNAAARDQVPLTLYLISFLRQFSEFRPR
jgi:asparagine synthase (glutamine-hydrolysing)